MFLFLKVYFPNEFDVRNGELSIMGSISAGFDLGGLRCSLLFEVSMGGGDGFAARFVAVAEPKEEGGALSLGDLMNMVMGNGDAENGEVALGSATLGNVPDGPVMVNLMAVHLIFSFLLRMPSMALK